MGDHFLQQLVSYLKVKVNPVSVYVDYVQVTEEKGADVLPILSKFELHCLNSGKKTWRQGEIEFYRFLEWYVTWTYYNRKVLKSSE